ncbi:MAG: bifunctional DNA-formamidopyrimidine glycosylase/DNA-(apurinic or apyrimidinic site) lyase [Pseudomonadota bacterium]
MPELPEVETTRLGIYPHLYQQEIQAITIREIRLRWPIDLDIPRLFKNKKITEISRRGKYLIIACNDLKLMIHLGMSGSLRIIPAEKSLTSLPEKHDHFDLVLKNGTILRYRDPRRFGALLYFYGDPQQHKLLTSLGPEPLSDAFQLNDFYQKSRGKTTTIKQYIMDAHQVVGVGNIYANEALFLSSIRPGTAAGRVSLRSFSKLHQIIKTVLINAIAKGGTTLKDFIAPSTLNNQNQAGYFQQELFVYDRAGKSCKVCGAIIKAKKISQRNSFYCPQCQR